MSNQDNLCMGCMNPLPEGRAECGICGYPANGENPPAYLPVRTVLSDRYLVGRLLDAGGDMAVYLGFDQVLKAPIYIREFFPDTLCERANDGSVSVIAGCDGAYREYCEKFRSHARTLARLRELSAIVSVYDIFEQNNTAYTVSEYCEGNTLEARLKVAGGRMRWEEVRPLFMPLLTALTSLHSAGLCHLGISPENLIVSNDGKLRLKGFRLPEARRVSTEVRPQLIPGYSAPEQYAFGEEPGPAADVYGAAAVIFRALTGNPPPEGSRRAADSNDLFVPNDVAQTLPDYVAAALFNALQVDPEKRTQSVRQFRDQLSTAPAVSAMREDEQTQVWKAAPPAEPEEEPEEEPSQPKDNRMKYALLIVLAVFIILLLIAGAVLLLLFPDLFSGKSDESSADSQVTYYSDTTADAASTTSPLVAGDEYPVPALVGKNYYDILDDELTGGMKLVLDGLLFSDRPVGEILDQSPSVENTAAGGSEIHVVISAGPETKTVPDVTGWDYRHAQLYLEALGFKVNVMRVVSEEYDYDLVESVSDAGRELLPGSTVTLRVSDTKKTTTTTTTTTTRAPTTTTTERNWFGEWFG
ncbi:MAG TPA: PASTA domain-containing protein [Firmicutes bacterium]|nr:PASTA domain-containing protein [Bacillota bacterium]